MHKYTARCPNRATTVRAHNWVVLGRLLANGSQPAWFLPQTGRLYCRPSQLPTSLEPFRTKCEPTVELFRQEVVALPGRHWAIFDGGFAFRSVVRPLVLPELGQPRIEFLTRLRQDARWCRLAPAEKPAGRPGPRARWGRRLSPPQGGRWPGAWRTGRAFIYGRQRRVCGKEVRCLWRVLGHETPVTAVGLDHQAERRR